MPRSRKDVTEGLDGRHVGHMASERQPKLPEREQRICAGYIGHPCSVKLSRFNNGIRCSPCEKSHRLLTW